MISRAWPAPAKLNLFLRVTGRRADGYHELQTAFQLLDLADSIDFVIRDDHQINRAAELPGIDPEQDLALRAARMLQRAAGVRLGANIAVSKRIPIGGGMGGGSSDAATTLVALNRLWGIDLGVDELAGLGLGLGADVPVFVHGHSAWAEGIGEILQPLELPARHYAVVFPGVAVRTAEIFQAPELTRNSAKTTIRGFLQAEPVNDCAPVVASRYPEVGRALDWLGKRGDARLTGTGSCVFAGFPDRAAAAAALDGLPAGWGGLLTRGLNQSPLQERLAAECAAREGDDRG